ncbi:MAG: hypothetical protein KBT34_13910 [Prevotella sp.]|nr:hypothetical protein [Candidatus Prevotella equi]
MKKIFSYILLLCAAISSSLMVSCSDKDAPAAGTDRQFMTMFICDNTRGKGSDYPYNSALDARYPHGNTIHLYWYGVKDCAGYQIQMSLPIKVANGADAWAKIQGTPDLLLDTIVGPEVLDMLLENLQYSTDYRFAIRALSTLDQNIKGDESTFAHASNWYGHGGGRQWAEYLNIKTKDRYPTPYAVYVDQSQTKENTMHVCINPNVKDFIKVFDGMTDAVFAQIDALNPITYEGVLSKFSAIGSDDKDKLESYFTNFNVAADGTFGYKYLQVKPSPSNPNSTVGEKWKYYEITDADRANGYIDIDGLTANSVYVIDVIDPTVPVAIDAKYNTCTSRSDGTPGAPILLKHAELLAEDGGIMDHPNMKRSDVFALAAQYNAAPLTPTLYDFISNTEYAEGQEFMLEGGKTYYIDGNDITCKGFVLRTDPTDVAKGLRAKVICGLGKSSELYENSTNGEQWQGSYTMFMFGRQPEAGEGGEIYMKKLAFYDIDFDNPTAFNHGDFKAGAGTVAGNYFFNMYSNGMAVTLDSLVIENCSFKRLVRGFVREQGPNYKKWNNVLIKNNLFYDCGYYNQGAGGYPWIAGAGTNPETNLYANFKCIENTFYDSPFPAFFNEASQSAWVKGTKWNITFSNNTLVNFNTRGAGNIFNMRYLPNGSIYTVENNLMVLCKQPGDLRTLGAWGNDIRETQTYEDGTAGVVKLNFRNNWCTKGSNFTANQWTSGSNSFAKLVKDQMATLNGELEVQEAEITAEDLFISPCPPSKATFAEDRHMHRADALDGTAAQFNVNLFIKNFNNEIVANNAGAARWRVAK